jgi:hypothetical protein
VVDEVRGAAGAVGLAGAVRRKNMPKNIPHRARTFDEQAQFDMEFAKRALLESGGLVPTFIVHGEEQMNVIIADWKDDRDKDLYRKLVRLICVAERAKAVSFMTEAWMRSIERRAGETSAEHRARGNAIRPSEAEDRVEIVAVNMFWFDDDKNKRSRSLIGEIIRNEKGKPTQVRPIHDERDNAGGAMADLLPENPGDATSIAIAREGLAQLEKVGLHVRAFPVHRH